MTNAQIAAVFIPLGSSLTKEADVLGAIQAPASLKAKYQGLPKKTLIRSMTNWMPEIDASSRSLKFARTSRFSFEGEESSPFASGAAAVVEPFWVFIGVLTTEPAGVRDRLMMLVFCPGIPHKLRLWKQSSVTG